MDKDVTVKMVLLSNYLFFGYFIHCFIITNGQNDSKAEYTMSRCKSKLYDQALCPWNLIANITRVYSGFSNQNNVCTPGPDDCTVDLNQPTYLAKYQEVVDNCEGRSACKRLYVGEVWVTCQNGTRARNDYQVIRYRCLPSAKGEEFQYFSQCTDHYIDKPLCQIGTKVDIYEIYFGYEHHNETCTVQRGLCASLGSDYDNVLNYYKTRCDGKLTCIDNLDVTRRNIRCNSFSGDRRAGYMVMQYLCKPVEHEVDARIIPYGTDLSQGSPLCSPQSRILVRDAYYVFRSTETQEHVSLGDMDCIRPATRAPTHVIKLREHCNGNILCPGLTVSFGSGGGKVRVGCGSTEVVPNVHLILYSCAQSSDMFQIICLEPNPIEQKNFSCLFHQAMTIHNIFLGTTTNRSCHKNLFKADDCLVRLEDLLSTEQYRDFINKCNNTNGCEIPSLPQTVTCNGITGEPDYFLVQYSCHQVVYKTETCNEENISIHCMSGYGIHFKSAKYVDMSKQSSTRPCSSIIDDSALNNDRYSCPVDIPITDPYYRDVLPPCEGQQQCQFTVKGAQEIYCKAKTRQPDFVRLEYTCMLLPQTTTELMTSQASASSISDITHDITVNVTSMQEPIFRTPIYVPIVTGVCSSLVVIVLIIVLVVVFKRKQRKTGDHTPQAMTTNDVNARNSLDNDETQVQHNNNNNAARMTRQEHHLEDRNQFQLRNETAGPDAMYASVQKDKGPPLKKVPHGNKHLNKKVESVIQGADSMRSQRKPRKPSDDDLVIHENSLYSEQLQLTPIAVSNDIYSNVDHEAEHGYPIQKPKPKPKPGKQSPDSTIDDVHADTEKVVGDTIMVDNDMYGNV